MLAEAFLNIVWKKATTVGFGQKGTHLVAWYCGHTKAPTYATLADPADYVEKPSCVTGADPTAFNDCFSKEAVKAANTYRD